MCSYGHKNSCVSINKIVKLVCNGIGTREARDAGAPLEICQFANK